MATRKEQALSDAEYLVSRMCWHYLDRATDDELVALRAALALTIAEEKRDLANTEILARRHPDNALWARSVGTTQATIVELEARVEQVRTEAKFRVDAATARIKALRRASK